MRGEIQHIGGRLPSPRELTADLDRHARHAAEQAASDALAVVRADAPGSFAGQSMTSSVRRTADGYQVTVEPVKKRRYIARFVSGGTGIYGPKRKRIRPRKAKAFKLNGREYSSVRGQRPNPFMARARERATAAAERAITRVGTSGR